MTWWLICIFIALVVWGAAFFAMTADGESGLEALSFGFVISAISFGLLWFFLVFLVGNILFEKNLMRGEYQTVDTFELAPVDGDKFVVPEENDSGTHLVKYSINRGPYTREYSVKEKDSKFVTGDKAELRIERQIADSIWSNGSGDERYVFVLPEE